MWSGLTHGATRLLHRYLLHGLLGVQPVQGAPSEMMAVSRGVGGRGGVIWPPSAHLATVGLMRLRLAAWGCPPQHSGGENRLRCHREAVTLPPHATEAHRARVALLTITPRLRCSGAVPYHETHHARVVAVITITNAGAVARDQRGDAAADGPVRRPGRVPRARAGAGAPMRMPPSPRLTASPVSAAPPPLASVVPSVAPSHPQPQHPRIRPKSVANDALSLCSIWRTQAHQRLRTPSSARHAAQGAGSFICGAGDPLQVLMPLRLCHHGHFACRPPLPLSRMASAADDSIDPQTTISPSHTRVTLS